MFIFHAFIDYAIAIAVWTSFHVCCLVLRVFHRKIPKIA